MRCLLIADAEQPRTVGCCICARQGTLCEWSEPPVAGPELRVKRSLGYCFVQGSGSAARDPHQKWVLRCTREAIRVNWHPTGGCALTARFRLRIRLSARISWLTVSCSLQKYSAYE